MKKRKISDFEIRLDRLEEKIDIIGQMIYDKLVIKERERKVGKTEKRNIDVGKNVEVRINE